MGRPEFNTKVVKVLQELGYLTGLSGVNLHRVYAYRRAATSIEKIDGHAAEMLLAGRAISFVGPKVSAIVLEVHKTGTCQQLLDLRKETVDEVPSELLALKGVGPVKARELFLEYGVTTLEEFRALIESGVIADRSWLDKIEFAKVETSRYLRSDLVPLVEAILADLRDKEKYPNIKAVDAAGSYRREKPTVRDLDILIACDSNAVGTIQRGIVSQFTQLELSAQGHEKLRFIDRGNKIQMDFHFCREETWGAAINYLTGSKDFNVAVRDLAKGKGLRINQNGIFTLLPSGELGMKLGGRNEKDLFDILGIPWVPAKLRETTYYIGKDFSISEGGQEF